MSETGECCKCVTDCINPDVSDLLGVSHQIQLSPVELRFEDDGEGGVLAEVLKS